MTVAEEGTKAPPAGADRPDPSVSIPLPRPTRGVAVLLSLVLLYAFAARLVVAVTVPPWQGPDEPKHFEAARVILDRRADWIAQRRYPGEHDESIPLQREILASFARHGGWTYVGQPTPEVLPASFYELWPGMSTQLARPSLYFLLAAAVLLADEDGGLERQLLLLRVFSALLSTAAVALTFVAALAAAPSRPWPAIAAAAFVAALPMHVFMGGTANSDNLATLLGSAAVAAAAWSIRRPGSWTPWLAAIALTGLTLLTKRTSFGLLPAIGWACFVPTRPRWPAVARRAGRTGSRLPLVLQISASAALLLALAWFGYQLLSAVPEGLPAYLFNEPEHPATIARLAFRSREVQLLLLWHLGWLVWSFWGIFGWWSIMLGDDLYHALTVVTALGALGFVLFSARAVVTWVRRREPAAAVEARLTLFMGLAAAGVVVLAVGERLVYQSFAEVPQGRYLFVAVAPIALAHVVGLRTLLPRRVVRSGLPLAAMLVGLVALDALAYLRYVAPYYGVPPLAG